MEALSGRMPLGPDTVIYLGEQPGAGVENALRFLARDLEFFYDLKLKVVRGAPPADGDAAPAIILGETPRFLLPADFCRKAGLDLPDHDEGYALSADERGVYIAARNERGLFYGVTTLVQLIGATREGLSIRGVQIRDWPALDFRGVHVLAGPSAERDLTPAVRELMARFKINTLVFEADHLFWDGHPELHWKERGMSKAAARKVMDAAAENMIEVLPLIQSLGHMDWLFYNKKYHKLAEDPKQPYAYCPTDPRSYEVVYSVYQEAVDFFKPRYFHIGHDEVHTASRFPWRSRDTGKTVGELFLDDVLKHHAWFTERGVRIMLWGDMFLYKGEAPDAYNAVSQEEAVRMRSRLPGDAIITDWHYEPADPEKYRSLAIFKELGLDAIGSGWDHPNNIRQLARASINNQSMGYLQTTWAGWDFKVLDNEPAWKQFAAYILAGHYSWSGDPTPPEDLPFNARDKFLEVYFPRKPILAVRPGFLVDLSPLANRTLEDNAVKSGWLGYGSERDFSTFPTGEVVLDGTRFLVKKNDKGQAALLLSGIFNPETASDMEGFPRRADIFLEPVQAAELHLLSCAAFRTAEHVTVAELEVTLEDGSVDKMPLVYARDLFAPDDARVGANAGIVWTGENASGETIRAWDLVWRNPQPELRIRKVSIVSKGTEAPPILFALTGVH